MAGTPRLELATSAVTAHSAFDGANPIQGTRIPNNAREPAIRQLAEILDAYRSSMGNPQSGVMFQSCFTRARANTWTSTRWLAECVRSSKASKSTGTAGTGSVVALVNWARTRRSSSALSVMQNRTSRRIATSGVRPGRRRSDEEARGYGRLGEPECTESSPNLEGRCGKMLKVNAGEVAERLKAAVC